MQQCVFQNFYFLKNCSNSNNLSKNFEIPIINKKHEKPQQKLRPYYQKFFQIAQFFYLNFSGSFLSKQVLNSLEEISSLSNILNEKNMFSKKTVSFAYLEILSKKNKKYLNLQNYLILYELNQIKKKIF